VIAMLITGAVGGWWPDRVLALGLALAVAVVVIAATALLGSVYLSATANGIAVFRVFGAGLAAGLLGQIGEGLNVESLERVFAVQLGPFGGAQDPGPFPWPWAALYVGLLGLLARAGFARRDL